MGIFGFRKKKRQIQSELTENTITSKQKTTQKSNESLDKLIDGDLPFGWVYHNREFTERINTEYRYFLNMWVDARNKSPKELYPALKSFVKYMEDVEKLCKSKGECFEFWFNEILTGKGYLQQRQHELKLLTENISGQQHDYELKQKILLNLDSSLLKFLQNNNGILQKDVYKNFDSLVKSDIQHLLYDWEKSGKIHCEKVGSSYKITL